MNGEEINFSLAAIEKINEPISLSDTKSDQTEKDEQNIPSMPLTLAASEEFSVSIVSLE